MPAAAAYYKLELKLRRSGGAFAIEASHRDPSSQAVVASERGDTALEVSRLRALQAEPHAYGTELTRQVFHDKKIRAHFGKVQAAAEASGHGLRLVIHVEPSATELQPLRWELLRHPDTDASLATSERILISRFMISRDWRPVKLRAKAALRAVVAVSAPPAEQLAKPGLAPVDLKKETDTARESLGSVDVRTLGGPSAPVTVDALVSALREETDILYLVCHGIFGRSTGTAALLLQDHTGKLKVVKGEALATRIGELAVGPRLVVLASCQSAGDGGDAPTSVQATLAALLADAGVPAVLAMQGNITMETVAQLMPTFFTELLRDGQIDRALAAARAAVRDRADAWMPALYLRLDDGRIWYTPGFSEDSQQDTWAQLVKPIREGRVVPIVGAGLLERIAGTAHDSANALAAAHGFPLRTWEREDLPRVAQFLGVKQSRKNVVIEIMDQLRAQIGARHGDLFTAEERRPGGLPLSECFARAADRTRENPRDPFRILASLPAKIYVTTTLDGVLERALQHAEPERTPSSRVSGWRYGRAVESWQNANVPEATGAAPLVFHLYGSEAAGEDTLVLTEDDYFDFLIASGADKLLPSQVEAELTDNSLLLLGFRLTDWSFRILFRLIMSLHGRGRLEDYSHVAVQVDPELHDMVDVNAARAYLAKYFGRSNIDIYWGTATEFLGELHDALEAHGGVAESDDDPEEDEDDDVFDF